MRSLSALGYLMKELIRNQDDEFNARLLREGGKILLIPDLKIKYYARPTLRKLCKMFYQYGLFKPLVVKKVGKPATIRQLVPPLFVAGTIAGLVTVALESPLALGFWGVYTFYVLGALYFAEKEAQKHEYRVYAVVLPFVFWCIHMSYGWGYLVGILRFVILRQSPNPEAIEISR